ncbi:MAG: peptidylprolyl isomerase [Polyangiaceae bacterium]
MLGEQVLVSLLRASPAWERAAVMGLGDLAVRRRQLGTEATTALLDMAASKRPWASLVFYPLGRAEVSEGYAKRLFDAARAALARRDASRILAVKALAKAPREVAKDAAAELVRVASDASAFDVAERAEASRGLGLMGDVGHRAAAEALGRIAPDTKDPVGVGALGGAQFHVVHTLIASLGPEPPSGATPTLRALSVVVPPAEPKPALALRLAYVRCAAAQALARGASDAEVLRKCDTEGGEPWESARLTALLLRPITPDRRAAFRALARSKHLRVRERAIEAIGLHPELRELGAELLAEALATKKAGLVATAAEVIHGHPDRALVLAASERRAALDPRAPPPGPNPAQELSADVAKALEAALAEKWPDDRFETRIALIEAAATVRHPRAKSAALAGCREPNVVLRERAGKALRSLGESSAACEGAPASPTPAAELGHELSAPAKVTMVIGGREVSLVLEPDLAPVTATRLAGLVRSGFYKGIVVHRVVPGFVAQLGDPDGDGYGGSGTPLRCETSPVPFERLHVGMALAGRDTGSSQFFVTLARTPHLDGEYTRVGHAEGPWEELVEGDVVEDARVVE